MITAVSWLLFAAGCSVGFAVGVVYTSMVYVRAGRRRDLPADLGRKPGR